MRFGKVVFVATAFALLIGGYTALFGQSMTGQGMTPSWVLQMMGPQNDVTGVSGYATTTLTGTLVDKPYVPVPANAVDTMSPSQVSLAAEAARDNSGIGIEVTQGSSTVFYPFDDNGKQLVAKQFPDKQPIGSLVVVKGELVGAGIKVSNISEANQ